MKRIYINETGVESVAIDYTDLPSLCRRPYTYAKLRAYLQRSKQAVAACDRCRVISQIGGVDVEPVAFTFQIRDDGVHLFAPELLDELGAFSGPHGCCFELWATIRAEGQAEDQGKTTGRIQYTRGGGIRCTIPEEDLLKKFRALSSSMRGAILNTIDTAIFSGAQRPIVSTARRVIQFPGCAAGE